MREKDSAEHTTINLGSASTAHRSTILHLATQLLSLLKMSVEAKVSSNANILLLSPLISVCKSHFCMQKVAVKVDVHDGQDKRRAMEAVSSFKGKSYLYLSLNLWRATNSIVRFLCATNRDRLDNGGLEEQEAHL